ncbi:hypothetical protein BDV27DRAFT_164396 [Aspergillus caelatus]|uniref:Uncharacterized protein n=1 Tax=Aspergillus caelatus TaxID=61420 RepID=A0A5N6ZIU0_9EURO|nr:uncharacterized protein BDV27DRAFT_164396 [Aspergillus caelatus]KAE8357564.1 hypothetical protein BDV27DRAFT_164396 [Aspergillus caelatus]
MAYSKRHGKHILENFGFGERGEGTDLLVECARAEVSVQTGIWIVKRAAAHALRSELDWPTT